VPALPGPALNLSFNWSMIRMSDVLLMYAEAVNEINGGPNTALLQPLKKLEKEDLEVLKVELVPRNK
jgi:hypothetical protein